MSDQLNQQAKQALHSGNYALAAKNWIEGFSLPQDETELAELFDQVDRLNNKNPNPDLCAILGLIALDHNDVFNPDREEALIQCIQWGKQGLTIDPEHYQCNRHTGSALYWLHEWDTAYTFYEKANQIQPSPVLEIRLFKIANEGVIAPDYSTLNPSIDGTQGMEIYNAGTELNHLVEDGAHMPPFEKERLTALKRQCYEHAYAIYRGAVVEKNGDLLNDDPLTFGMCCNNLALELSDEGQYERAIAITTEVMAFYSSMYILQNRFSAYLESERYQEAIADGEQLIEEYIEQMDFVTYLNTIDHICACYMELKFYQEALEWVEEGFDAYYSFDPTDPIIQEEEVVRCFTNFFIYKANIDSKLGIAPSVEEISEDTDSILEHMPDNPSILIGRGNTFVEQGSFEKGLVCYQHAIRFALEKGLERSVQVAYYNMGYMQIAHRQAEEEALISFEKSIEAGNNDFWCYYWAMKCAYFLSKNQPTVYYGQQALAMMVHQEDITNEIMAEVYEHIGTSQLDLRYFDDAIANLTHSLQYEVTKTAGDNLQLAQDYKKSSSGFFGKLFGK